MFSDEIINETKNRNVIVKHLDLSSQKSIREFAKDINRTEPKLDVLIHNAGMAADKIKMSEDKIEMTMATNHFGPFLLTHLLIGKVVFRFFLNNYKTTVAACVFCKLSDYNASY